MSHDDGIVFPIGFGHVTIKTKDGRPLTIRHVSTADAPLLAELLGSLSPESRYMRFFTPRGIPDERLWSEAIRLADIDPRMHVALLATATEDGREWAVAEARLIRDDDNHAEAEVAIMVRDDWQQQGIGRALFDLLVQVALVQGLHRLYAIALRENRGMRHLVQNLGLPSTSRSDGAETIYWIELVERTDHAS